MSYIYKVHSFDWNMVEAPRLDTVATWYLTFAVFLFNLIPRLGVLLCDLDALHMHYDVAFKDIFAIKTPMIWSWFDK